MRCHTIRKKIISLQGKLDGIYNDPTIGDHLSQCTSCQVFARSEASLHRDLTSAREYTPATQWSVSAVRKSLQARITVHDRKPSFLGNLLDHGGHVMNLVNAQLKRRPKLSLSFGLMAMVLLLSVTIPFNVGEKIEYQVAMAAIDPDLVLNAEELRRALGTLEIKEADVDVTDCNTRCKVTVSHLRNLDEVRIVLAAFDEIGNCFVEDISESRTSAKSTLMKVVGENLFIEGEASKMTDVMRSKFNEDTGNWELNFQNGEFVFWVQEDGDESSGALKELLTLNKRDGHTVVTMNMDLEEMTEGGNWWENACMPLVDPQGNRHEFFLDDPVDRAALEKMGLDLETLRWRNGAPEWPDETTDEYVEADAEDKGMLSLNNHPNPFNPTTLITFSLPQTERVTLDVYNIRGQKVRRLLNETLSEGTHSIEWNSTDDNGNRVASGVYLYQLRAGEQTASKKMILTK